MSQSLFDRILLARGITSDQKERFLLPDYSQAHDPFLLPDMEAAVERIVKARQKQEHIAIYGDYDIDGLTATTLLFEALKRFGFSDVETYIPNRFSDGYGLTVGNIEKIAASGATLIITVDCGSLSVKEVARANELGVDVIVTDHHEVSEIKPSAIAVVNPKRPGHDYPFRELSGVGVAFKLVRALQTRLGGLDDGQEKWLLDLVALGTVCDVVPLLDENRINAYWGIKVLAKARRAGLKSLMSIAMIDPQKLTSRSLGFGLGPRMNAAGRLETATSAMELLTTSDSAVAMAKAYYLDDLNKQRRVDQDRIFREAICQVELHPNDPVIVVSGEDWNHGIVGIVAAKLLEKYKKPAFVFQKIGENSKGSARSFGDFSAIAAVRNCDDIIIKGGGHKLAAGITLLTQNLELFRQRVNEFYINQALFDQASLLLPLEDARADIGEITEELVDQINLLEPFGNGNPQPIIKSEGLTVKNLRQMGASGQHVRLELEADGRVMQFLAFNADEKYFAKTGSKVSVWYNPEINEWQNRRSVEGRLLHIEIL